MLLRVTRFFILALQLKLASYSSEPNQRPHTMSITERTYIMVKPDGVQRALVGNIISRFEARGFKLVALKMVHATPEHLEKR